MPETKNIVSWNIQFGTVYPQRNGYTANTRLGTELEKLLAESDLENLVAVACQEVDRYQIRSHLQNQPAEIWQVLREREFQWASYAPTYLGLNLGIRLRPATFFPRIWQQKLPASGVFLALKEKPLAAEFLPLGKSTVRWHSFNEKALENLNWWHPFKLLKGKPVFGESRVALVAETASAIYATTHLEVHPVTAKQQLRILLTYLITRCDKTGKPAYLVGDFNMKDETVTSMIASYTSQSICVATTPSFPAKAPTKSIDYFVSVHPKEKVQATSLESCLSDHCPILFSLECEPIPSDFS